MEITWYGLSCFRITERKLATIVTDPFAPAVGLGELKLRADIVTISHDAPGHNYPAAVTGVEHRLTGPGEYDIGDVPSQKQIEDLELVNVLLVPVGAGSSLNAARAAELVSMLEPNIVVPMHYQVPGLTMSLEPLEKFLKEMGVTEAKSEASLKLGGVDGLPQETEVITLAHKEQIPAE